MSLRFTETTIPQNLEKRIDGLQDSVRAIGQTDPKPLLPLLKKTTAEEPAKPISSWSSKVVELNFDLLTKILKDYETDYGISTIEMFNRFMSGELVDDPIIDDWFNSYLLYLGTSQVRQYSCP